jgi:hypothetical protein
MKRRLLFLAIFVPFCVFSQLTENFSDGNFSENPFWQGNIDRFIVNDSQQLQSSATSTSVSSIFTFSEAFNNAQWECRVKINYTTSSSNFASIYIISDNFDISTGCNAYYVQVGGTNDEVSLFVQQGTKKTKIIDGIDKRTDLNPVEIDIRVTRDQLGNFELMSRLANETDFLSEGIIYNNDVKSGLYFGLLYSNTNTTGSAYFFDDIIVKGEKALDFDAPVWTEVKVLEPAKLQLSFSERMNFDDLRVLVDAEEIGILAKEVSADKKSILLNTEISIEKGHLYKLELFGVSDVANNVLLNTKKDIGIIEDAEVGDLLWNEIMFENPLNSSEYVEIFNRSNKVIDLVDKIISTRKTDGSLNTGNKIESEALVAPYGYMAFTISPDSVRIYHDCPEEAKIVLLNLSTLNNSMATLVLCDNSKEIIYDEISYNSKWHHQLIKDAKGVALEKIHPDLTVQDPASWHSASSETNYGTPGYKNSQYKEFDDSVSNDKFVWTDPEIFTPNNDGQEDFCFIHYNLNSNGYVANISILNAAGVKVCKLVSNNLLSTSGFVRWDGRTDRGNIATSGIYILYFETFNPNTGDKKVKKLPIAISSR